MSWETIKREWSFVCQQVFLTWGKLSEDDLIFIAGDRDRFIKRYEHRYGGGEANASVRIDEFAMHLRSPAQKIDAVSHL